MDGSINDEDKKQAHQKPPRNLGRIACEILAGTVTGFSVAISVVYVILIATVIAGWRETCFGGFVALAIIVYLFPMVYGPASAVGVYLVGSRGKQTSSFLLTLGSGFLGGLIMLPMFFFACLASGMFIGVEKIVLWPLVFISAPIMATLGFNLTRRYKEPPSS